MSTTTTDRHRPPLSTGAATLLVAEREISTQVRSRAFLISLAITVLVVIGGIFVMNLFGGQDDEDPVPAAVVGLDSEAVEALEEAGLEVTGTHSMDEAEELLREEEVEAVVAADAESPAGVRVIGLDSEPAEVAQLLSASPTTEVLEEGSADQGLRFLVAAAFGAVFMFVGIGSGMMIVQNTIQEKQNRIVEILLSAIPARALLGGKILGNSVLALGQAVVMAAASVAGLLLTGQQDMLDILTVPMLWFVLFFIPGFVLIASMFAAGASLVSRQEDSGAVVSPTMMLVMAPYFVVIFLNDNPTAMAIASYVPFSAPVAMPSRMFFNEAAWFEPLAALGVLALSTLLVAALAAKIYSRSLLQTGQRVSLKTALSSSET